MSFFEQRHVVAFEDTNLIGNVYYVKYFSWQGRCREMFIRAYCPELLDELSDGLALVTTRCSCEFLQELAAFDEVAVRMRLGELGQSRVTMLFEYWRVAGASEELVAHGEQQVAFMRRETGRLVAAKVTPRFREAVEAFVRL